jgi:hypothetical protein
MNKLRFIRNFGELGRSYEKTGLFRAFVNCLKPDEACQALDLHFQQESLKRCALIGKIANDMEHKLEECHLTLISELMQGLSDQPYIKKQSFAYCLDSFYKCLPKHIQKGILYSFLYSEYRNMRRRAYNRLSANWNDEYRHPIEEVWLAYRDKECASLIIQFFPIDYIQINFLELEEVAIKKSYINLFRRLIPLDEQKLEILAERDEITYVYILTQQNKNLHQKDALILYNRNKCDDRIGLLIWCFGQMKLWRALEAIYEDIDNIAKYRLESFAERYGLQIED